MARTNIPVPAPVTFTHEGGKAARANVQEQLRRSVLSCLLWENEFYESGVAIAERLKELVAKNDGEFVANLARVARTDFKLRHVPLFLVREMARNVDQRHLVANALTDIIQRPDEIGEFLALYWKDKPDAPLAAQVKKGLAAAFNKFNEYELAKWDQGGLKLRNVMFLVHPKPANAVLDEGENAVTIAGIKKKNYKRDEVKRHASHVFTRIAENKLETPDTWEVALSGGADKKSTFERLIQENKLGALALLRNLRGMTEAGVDRNLIIKALQSMKTERVLPFRFISAARHAPQFEQYLEQSMFKSIEEANKLNGRTTLLIDVSGSMDHAISGESDLRRIDAACALAILLREICQDVQVYTFSKQLVEVPARRGFALRDAIVNSQPHKDTYLGAALDGLGYGKGSDRIIVITDEQSADKVNGPKANQGYLLNVASAKNGVGYGKWNHIDGWSESIVRYIQENENAK